MKTLFAMIVAIFVICASSQAQIIVGKDNQTKKGDDEIYSEFQRMVKAGVNHMGFLVDKSGKPLPIYRTTTTKPPKKVRTEPIAPKIKVGLSKNDIINILGYPDDYLLVVKAGPNPNDINQDIIEEQWFYGKTAIVFDTKQDNCTRIDVQ